jgi:hypothetical protein
VLLDSVPLGAADGRAFAVDPGAHTIAARLDGYVDAVEARTMRARDTPKVHLHLERKPDAGTATAAETPASGAAPRPSAVRSPVAGPSAEPVYRLFLPAWSPRGVLVTATYASALTALVAGGLWIGFALDRDSLRRGLDRTTCSPILTPRLAACDALAERIAQVETLAPLTVAAAGATVVFAAASGLAIGLERRASAPVTAIAPAANPQGGGIVVFGLW